VITCNQCNGSGHKVVVQQTPFGRIQQTIQCNHCNGDGNIPKNKCNTCHGSGITVKDEIVDVNIPSGAIDGMQLIMEGNGNHIKNGIPGDLFLIIKEIPDDKFKRRDIDLICEEWISITDAVFGTSMNIDTPHGVVNLRIPNGCESGRVFEIRGKGIPNLSNNGRAYVSTGNGNLNIKANVAIKKY
jgi:molecular chaperone DnaJ